MLLDAALAYARHGIPVLPVHSPERGGCSCGRVTCPRPGKHPRLRHGLTEASADPGLIERWWQRWPAAGIGLRTGIVMDVADVDSAEGLHGLRSLLGDAIPAGPVVRTGGGWHFWFQPTGYGNRVRLLPGVDWRGVGGYVLAPPSAHAAGRPYAWIRRPSAPLPPVPAALRELVAGPVVDGWPHRTIVHPQRYAAVALEAEADRVARAPAGSRNHTLNRAAFVLGRLVGAGLLDERTVTAELTAAAHEAGLSPAEVAPTVRSGLRAGRRAGRLLRVA